MNQFNQFLLLFMNHKLKREEYQNKTSIYTEFYHILRMREETHLQPNSIKLFKLKDSDSKLKKWVNF